jgi:hypothetical protein
LQPLSEAWFALRALSAVRSEWCAPEGYKCMHRRAARVLAPVFTALRLLGPRLATMLVSYMPLARLEAQKRKAGLDDQAKSTKVVHCDGTNQITIDQSLTYC